MQLELQSQMTAVQMEDTQGAPYLIRAGQIPMGPILIIIKVDGKFKTSQLSPG